MLSSGGLVEITTTGRRTHEPRRIRIVAHVIDGRIYISGIPSERKRGWLANLEADHRLTLHLAGSVPADIPAVARIIDDEPERRSVLARVARSWRRADVEAMVRFSPLIEVVPERVSSGPNPG